MIYAIEAHSDDVFLSVGQTLENWIKAGERVKIVTVYSGTRKRGLDAQNYAEALGADWLGLGLVEKGGGVKGNPASLEGKIASLVDLVEGAYDWRKDKMIIPLAVTHPEHVAVRKFVETQIERQILGTVPYSLQYYLDAPYQITQKNSETVSRLLAGMKIVSYCKPSIRKWRHIKYFRDQSKFWHLNPPSKLRECFELIVER